MKIVSLIYTNRINPNVVGELLKEECGFSYFKGTRREKIFQNSLEETTVKVNGFKIEIMYKSIHSYSIAMLIKKLSAFNKDRKITIKKYDTEEKDNINQFLELGKYYFA